MKFRTKNTRNYLSSLPSKTEIKTPLDKTDDILNEIKSAIIKTEDNDLLEFYSNYISFIETHYINEDGKFEMNRYAELRNNLVSLEEEFIKSYGKNILNYVKNDKETLKNDLEYMDSKYDFTTRSIKVKKRIKENDKVKEIYVREKREAKEYDFILYMNEISSSIQHIVSKEIDNKLSNITTREEFFKLYEENKEEIVANISNNIDLLFGFLKDTEITVFRDIYSFLTNNMDELIMYILRTTAQFSRFYQIDVFSDYAHERNTRQVIRKVKKEIRFRNI